MKTFTHSLLLIAVFTLAFVANALDSGATIPSMTPPTRYPCDQLGVITGTLQWPTSAIPSRFSLPSTPGLREPLTDIMNPFIELRAYAARSGRPVGSLPQYSNLTENGGITRVTYKIIDVPLDVSVFVAGRQKHGGIFGPTNPVTVTPGDLTATDCDMGLLQ